MNDLNEIIQGTLYEIELEVYKKPENVQDCIFVIGKLEEILRGLNNDN